MKTFWQILALVLVSCYLFLFGLGSFALTDPDESFYAQTAREMTEKNDIITPYIFGKPQFEKPVMYYWLIMASYKVFGINEFAARFPSALFGILGVIGVYFLARLIFRSDMAGFLSAVVMSTSAWYFILARACVTDMVLGVFILYCLYFFLRGMVSGGKRFFLLASAMAALAVLTKGPIGLFLPGVVIMVYMFTGKRLRELPKIPVFWSVLLFLAISVPWYVIAFKLHGKAFTDEFLGLHNITRFTVPEHRIGASPFFYFPIVVLGFLPWTAFAFWSVYNFFREKCETADTVPGYKLFLAAWFLTVFVFFSASSTKLVTYIFPLFPVLAVMTGRAWQCFIEKGEGSSSNYRGIRYSSILYFIVCTAGIVGGYVALVLEYPKAIPAALHCMLFFGFGVAVSLFYFIKGARRELFASIVFTVLILVMPAMTKVTPIVEAEESSKRLTELLKGLSGPDDPWGGECDHRRGIAYYSDRKDISDVNGGDKLKVFLARPERVWAIVRQKHYDKADEAPDKVYIEKVAASGEYVLITNKPLAARSEGNK
jgi:4-amino-4-deoxy-L-arabinose transferase-like glycosyltransferase